MTIVTSIPYLRVLFYRKYKKFVKRKLNSVYYIRTPVEEFETLTGFSFRPLSHKDQGENSLAFRAWRNGSSYFFKNMPHWLANREFDIIKSIGEHPNIVKMHGLISTGVNSFALIFEYLEGGNLRQFMKAASPTEAVSVLIPTTEALDWVHQQGWTHRDLKPEAIVFDSSGNPKLTDFGLAARTDQPLSGSTKGTTPYAAPEQFFGDFSPACDIHALGVIALEIITGLSDDKLGDLVTNIWNGAVVTDLPEEIAQTLTRCISRNPEDRPSITELQRILRTYTNSTT